MIQGEVKDSPVGLGDIDHNEEGETKAAGATRRGRDRIPHSKNHQLTDKRQAQDHATSDGSKRPVMA